jgi:hypothetical protein
MGRRAVVPYSLPYFESFKPLDYRRTEQETDEQRRKSGVSAPKRYVLKYVKRRPVFNQRIKKF